MIAALRDTGMAKKSAGRDIGGENNPAHSRTGWRSPEDLRAYAKQLEVYVAALKGAADQTKAAGIKSLKIDGITKMRTAILNSYLFCRSLKKSMVDRGLPVDDIAIPPSPPAEDF